MILVSFCNIKDSARPALALLDPSKSLVRVVDVPREVGGTLGITGLALSARHVFAVRQSPPALLVLDRRDLRLALDHPLREVVDGHSICLSGDRLYVVSTGSDELVEMELRDEVEVVAERVIWRPDPDAPRSDLHHLNGVCEFQGDVHVCGFGKKTSDWASASDGFIFNVTRHAPVAEHLLHPHSILGHDGRLVCCESRRRSVRVPAGPLESERLPGYSRGLCAVGPDLYVGTSQGRRVSKSTGLINNPADPGELAGRSTVSRLETQSLKLVETVDLDDLGEEIYDLLEVTGTEGWPLREA
jgi:hypothetical protein